MTKSENTPKLNPGDSIGKYTLLRMLGYGKNLSVYLAEQQIINRKVAIMLYDADDKELLAATQKAISHLAFLDHPHIVKLYDADEYKETFFAVVEYIEGSSLWDMIQSKNELPITVVLKLLICIADALDHMHSRGIIHGDVKPANVMVSLEGVPVLVSFGVIGVIDSDVFRDQVVGTPQYLSPENWVGNRGIQSDLWAFGITLFELITGELPIAVTENDEIKFLVTSQTELDLSKFRKITSKPVIDIIEKCLQKDLSKRYQSATEVRRDLESALAYLESKWSEITSIALEPGNAILLDVEYEEPGIPGQYREYQIIKEIGSGNYSTVFLAKDVIGNREAALKILRREKIGGDRILSRFKREAKFLARINHPNIVKGYNYGQYGADCFIVMEMLSGITLEQAIDSDFVFDYLHALVVTIQILNGLDKIHAERTIHRDIKPANIMLLPDRAVVMDIGIAHFRGGERLTKSGEIVGTPRYLSPEQARGERITFHSDLFSVGVILYELLTGKIPFLADSTAGLIFKIATEVPDPISKHRRNLPQSIISFFNCMIAREPENRFQSTQLAAKELLACANLLERDIANIHCELYKSLDRRISQ